ncbi:hypothetical protein [Oculatella sp. LEGE 06141]|uniref:hypothetical protein n=1 Tax=Oculatella sp. LEGE 06141 TaxID=1828648 RepID=UPI0030D98AEF
MKMAVYIVGAMLPIGWITVAGAWQYDTHPFSRPEPLFAPPSTLPWSLLLDGMNR